VITAEDKSLETGVTGTLLRLWPMLRRFRWRFFAGAGLVLLSTAIELVSPILIGKTVDAAMAGAAARQHLITLCSVYLVLIVLRAVMETIQSFVIQATGQEVTHELRCRIFERIERLPVAYFDRNPTGRLLTRVINDIKSLSEMFTASISVLALDVMTIVGTVIAMFLVNTRLALFVLLTFPAVAVTIVYFGRRLAVAYRKVRVRLAEINAFLGENIAAIGVIQRLCAEEQRLGKFERICNSHLEAQLESTEVYALVQPLANILNGIAVSTLLVVGGYWVIEQRLSLGMLVAFLGYLRNLFQPIRDLVEKYNTFLSAAISAERVVGVLGERTETAGDVGTQTSPVGAYGIEFSGVSFTYPMRQKPALEDVSFRIPPGQSLAIVGATGSGKSTLIRLLLRFYEPGSGRIVFGGHSLGDWDRLTLRSRIGVVHQEIYLVRGTLRENLTLGQDRFGDAYLTEQCRRAQLWDFVRERGGLDLLVQEGGANLSLGERQLISFARVLVFDTPVLVLDEATSSMDRVLERRLLEAIRESLAGRTSIVIAHRLSTIRRCDQIIVLEKARLRESGTYDSLVGAGGIFSHFHRIHSHA
jgi:ATP-binding cassette subfamily B protein